MNKEMSLWVDRYLRLGVRLIDLRTVHTVRRECDLFVVTDGAV